MLFLLFQLGKDRYALESSRVVEVLPYVQIKAVPDAPRGVAGLIAYRGQAVPVVDLSMLILGVPAPTLLSTRIIVTQSPDRNGQIRIIGLLAENATDVVRKQAREFQETGLPQSANSYLGPVTMDARGPVQWLHEDRLLSEPIQRLLDKSPPAIPA